jgi:hypothetical protein
MLALIFVGIQCVNAQTGGRGFGGEGIGNAILIEGLRAPGKVLFTMRSSNQFVSTDKTSFHLNVTQGNPVYAALVVDSSNFSSAVWVPYSGKDITVDIGPSEGWHDVWIGLKGINPNTQTPSDATWQWRGIKYDHTPPTLVITDPPTSITSLPTIQLMGYSPEPVGGLTCDLANSKGVLTGRSGFVSHQFNDILSFEFTTNWFEFPDIDLKLGTNIITLHATDKAGNVTATNFTFVLVRDTNAPGITVAWPTNGTRIAGTNYSIDGWLSNPTAEITLSMVDPDGATNFYSGLVETTGRFWIEHLPMYPGSNTLVLTAKDTWGNSTTTNMTLIKGGLALKLDPIDPNILYRSNIRVTGTVSDPSATVFVNGVQATVHGTNWSAENVPVSEGGTASFRVKAFTPDEKPDR